jgi:hypothetical protein
VAVPCRSDNHKFKSTGMTTCTVPPHQLYADDGPYTVSVVYPGGGALRPSAASLKQAVVPAGSRTRLRLTPIVSAGEAPSITALVSGLPASAGTPRGAVRFFVAGSSGQMLHCRGGNTVALSSGRATCRLAGLPQTGVLNVSADYRGDGNFTASTSHSRSLWVKHTT